MRTFDFVVKAGEMKGKPVYVREYPNPAEYAAELIELAKGPGFWGKDRVHDLDWYDASGQTLTGFCSDLTAGGTARHASSIAKARRLIDVPAFRLYGPTVGLSVGAGVPIIPAVLAGIPEHNLTMTETADTTTPVKVVFERASSAGLDSKDLEKVGATIAAVVEIIQASRPVEVWVSATLDPRYTPTQGAVRSDSALNIRVKLNSHPSAAEIGLYCVSLGPIRRGAYSIGSGLYGCPLLWAFGRGRSDTQPAVEDMLTEHDIYIPHLHLHSPLVENPKAWAEAALVKAFGAVEA